MLDIGSFPARTCHGLSCRSFLRLAASVPLALGTHGAAGQLRAAQPVRARSVLFVFLWGAPSHLDTIDPKPDAPAEYRGPFGTIPTRTSGLRFTELLPLVAQRSRLFTVCRTHTTSESGHPEAGTVALTGFKEKPGPLQPNFGAILARHRGHARSLPPFISLARGTLADSERRIQGLGGGTLSASCDPFLVGCSERGQVDIPALQVLDGLAPQRINDRLALLNRLDAVPRTLTAQGFNDWDHKYQAAYSLLMKPEARRAFDLTAEKPATRGRYGQSSFGQSCLLARRLVEAGVPYVQVNYSRHPEAFTPAYEFGWDTHIYNFELLQDQHCPIFDRAFSALLDDLHERGLLSQTLVVCMGEFGRTPKISARAARDHWPQCYPSIWAGAGIPGGRTIGESDERGAAPRSGPVITPLQVGTTIAELAGVDTEARAALRVLDGGSVIHELIQAAGPPDRRRRVQVFAPAHRRGRGGHLHPVRWRDADAVDAPAAGRRRGGTSAQGDVALGAGTGGVRGWPLPRLRAAPRNPVAGPAHSRPQGGLLRGRPARPGLLRNASPTIAPDNSRVLYSYAEGGRQKLFSADLRGGDRKVVVASTGIDNWPSYSPDGKRVVFGSSRGGTFDVHVMRADGSEIRRLTSGPFRNIRPRFSPDGAHIAFTGFREGRCRVFVMRADGTDVRRVETVSEGDDYPSWHPDGKRLVVVSECSGRHDLYLVNAPI